MDNLIIFLFYSSAFLLIISALGWLADNTKIFDKFIEKMED